VGKIKFGQPTKPSFQELRKQLQAKGHGKTERKRLDGTLDTLERMLEWRPHLTHGCLGVWQGRDGNWLITLRHAQGDCSGPVRWHAYPSTEAHRMLGELRSEVERFNRGAEYLIEHLAKVPSA
jgi:hypothetical protein